LLLDVFDDVDEDAVLLAGGSFRCCNEDVIVGSFYKNGFHINSCLEIK
jgi:hypothetical protein